MFRYTIAFRLPSPWPKRRPDVVAAERLVLAAFCNLEADRLALLPSFALNFDGGRITDALLSADVESVVLPRTAWHDGADLCRTGGRLTAQVKIGTAQQQQPVAHYRSVVLNAFTKSRPR